MTNLIPIAIVIALIVVSLTCQRLQKSAQPLRLQLAEKGERLMGDPNLPSNLVPFVSFLLDTAFKMRAILLIGIFYVPYLWVRVLVVPDKVERDAVQFQIQNPETRVKFDDVVRLHNKITLANHPFLYTFLELEMTILMLPVIIIGGLFRDLRFENVNRGTAMGIVETKGRQVQERMRRPKMALQ